MLLTCSYGPYVDDIALEKVRNYQTLTQFLMWTSEMNRFKTESIQVTVISVFRFSKYYLGNCTARQCSPLRRKFMECYNQASSIASDETSSYWSALKSS